MSSLPSSSSPDLLVVVVGLYLLLARLLVSGLAYPPLYFYSGGVKEFLATIKQHVLLLRSAEDANVFLVNDSQHTLQRALSSLELPRAVSVACGPSVDETNLNENQEKTDSGANNLSASVPQFHGRPKHKAHDPRDLSIQVLEKFSLVIRFARKTTSQLFGENQNNGFSGYERSTQIQPNLDQPKKSTDIAENVPAENPEKAKNFLLFETGEGRTKCNFEVLT